MNKRSSAPHEMDRKNGWREAVVVTRQPIKRGHGRLKALAVISLSDWP